MHTNYGSQGLEISFSKSNENTVRGFADLIISETKNYLLNKYARVDKDLPKEGQIDILISLRDRDILDEAEFTRLKNIVLDKETERKIGFN